MNEQEKIVCPVCGSDRVNIVEGNSMIQAPYGPHVEFADNTLHCNACETDVDYSKVFENSDKQALEKSIALSVEQMIESLGNEDFTLAYIERALELPQRTISRWKASGELSKIGIALLRIVRTYPWILKVSEHKFDAQIAKKVLVENGMKVLMQYFAPNVPVSLNQVGFSKEMVQTNQSGTVNFTFWAKGEAKAAPELKNKDEIFIATNKLAEV
jgi:hypothetical protein